MDDCTFSPTCPTSDISRGVCSDIGEFLRLLWVPGETYEVRSPECPDRLGGTFLSVHSGYFRDVERAAPEIKRIAELRPEGVYCTLNPVNPTLLARSAHRIKAKAKATSKDDDILRREWLMIDVDAKRPVGMSSTDAEVQAALGLAEKIRDELAADSWPDALLCMSGNGAYVLYRIELPNDDESTDLVKRVLRGLADRFNNEFATVDLSASNPSRILKVMGTYACKGTDMRGEPGMDDRPHRQSWFEPPASKLNIVPRDLLEAVAVAAKPTTKPASVKHDWNGHTDQLTQLIKDCDSAAQGSRSPRDFALCAYAVENRIDREELWSRVEAVGKFAEGGRRYFDVTWENAEAKIGQIPAVDLSGIERQGSAGDNHSDQQTGQDHDDRGSEQQSDDDNDPFSDFPVILTGSQLIATYPELRPIIVDGLVRKGDVCNIIAAPKVGKSWLALGLALSVASGQKWLRTFQTTTGRVLYIDNELDPSDSAWRLQQVAKAMQVGPAAIGENIHYSVFRGKEAELARVCKWLENRLQDRPEGFYQLVVIDTLSKFLAGDRSENDNLYIRSIYARLERLASQFGFAICIIHHSSRGDQSEKQITDVGAGAGAQSRACDAHVVIRPHSDEEWCVMDSTVRSFPGNGSLSIRWEFPLWDGDPTKAPELGNRQTKVAADRGKQLRRLICDTLEAEIGERFSVNRLHERLAGFGVAIIKRTCETLAEEERIHKTTSRYHGQDYDVYYYGN